MYKFSLIKIIGVNILPLMLVVFLLPQSIYVSIAHKDTIALLLLAILLLGIFSYYLSITVALSIVPKLSLSKSSVNIKICKLTILIFIVINILLFAMYGSIPWLKSINTGLTPSIVRHDFGQHFEGSEFHFLIYLRSIFLRGILPIAIVYLARFVSERYLLFILLSLSLVLISVFEKANLFWVYLPVIFYFLLNRKFKEAVRLSIMLGFFFLLVTAKSVTSFVFIEVGHDRQEIVTSAETRVVFTSKPSLESLELNSSEQESDVTGSKLSTKNAKYKDFKVAGLVNFQGDYRFIFGNDNAVQYMLNRAFWIPFITAYDTILYWQRTYNSEIGFSINRHLSRLSRNSFSDIEREVHRFQFGGNFDSTGNANAAYLAEAFIGFGYFGVIVFSALIGFIYAVFTNGRSVEGNLALISISFGLVNASLVSMLFSGGVVFALFFFLVLHVLGRNSVN